MTKTKMVDVSRKMDDLESKISKLIQLINNPYYDNNVKMAYKKAKDIGLIKEISN